MQIGWSGLDWELLIIRSCLSVSTAVTWRFSLPDHTSLIFLELNPVYRSSQTYYCLILGRKNKLGSKDISKHVLASPVPKTTDAEHVTCQIRTMLWRLLSLKVVALSAGNITCQEDQPFFVGNIIEGLCPICTVFPFIEFSRWTDTFCSFVR